MKNILLIPCLLFVQGIAFAAHAVDPGEILQKARATYVQLNDYTCLFNRRELFKGKIKDDEGMVLKYMKPSHYYLKWPSDVIEAIYVVGANDGKMIIHGGLVFKFLRVKIRPEKALEYGRHTLAEVDIGHVLGIIEKNYQQSLSDNNASINYEGIEIFDSIPTHHFRAKFPADSGYYGHIIDINLHAENGLPLKLVVYDWNNALLEHYEYTQLKLNVGLTPQDFDIDNPSYQFKQGKEVDAK